MSVFRIVAVVLALSPGSLPAAEPPDWVVAVFPSGAEFTVQIRSEPMDRALGYMFREEVGPAEGMLFVFPGSERHSFWMKNCLVPLDIIWLDQNYRVVDMALEQPPCKDGAECPSVYPSDAARLVLEVAAGRAAQEGLAVGDRLVVLPDLALGSEVAP